MQAYGDDFAAIYNMRWTHFARQVAPRILVFYEDALPAQAHHRVLDLACGTGQLAVYFLEHGYDVVGLDLSSAMLDHARAHAQAYIEAGRARFMEADAADFTLDGRFGLVISTFDALNHLPDFTALESCFRSVHAVLVPDGWFIFDLNTRLGLRRWAGITVQEEEDLVLITRGVVVEEEGRAFTQISGFLRQEDGRYKRFGQVAYNTIFDLADVADALREIGFRQVHFAVQNALGTPLEDPEAYGRVFVVARR